MDFAALETLNRARAVALCSATEYLFITKNDGIYCLVPKEIQEYLHISKSMSNKLWGGLDINEPVKASVIAQMFEKIETCVPATDKTRLNKLKDALNFITGM